MDSKGLVVVTGDADIGKHIVDSIARKVDARVILYNEPTDYVINADLEVADAAEVDGVFIVDEYRWAPDPIEFIIEQYAGIPHISPVLTEQKGQRPGDHHKQRRGKRKRMWNAHSRRGRV